MRGQSTKRWKVLVVWSETGETEFVKNGTQDAVFHNKREAQEAREFFEMGMDDGEATVAVVRA